jgi:hypothetical protein
LVQERTLRKALERRGHGANGEIGKLSEVIQIDEGKFQAHLGEVVRGTVEETLNALLDAEADRLCCAEHCERTEARKDPGRVPTSGNYTLANSAPSPRLHAEQIANSY